MIFCSICGTENLKDNNYCTHCGNRIAIENICPNCGTVNEDSLSYCKNCNEQLKPIFISDFDLLFTDYNKNLLENADLSVNDYMNILRNTFKKAEFTKIKGHYPKDKVLSLAKTFANCRAKSRGAELGSSMGNIIYYDDRLDDSLQIATIIHELAHCLLFDIFVNILTSIFKVKSSSTLDAFVWHLLSSFENLVIMNEYCAHTVEGRFIPYGYQNYGSFNKLLENSSLDYESTYESIVLGNNFANDIIVFLEKYIDDDLRKSIKLQYKKDLSDPCYDSLNLETVESFDLYKRNKKIITILNRCFKEASNNLNRDELIFLKNAFETF